MVVGVGVAILLDSCGADGNLDGTILFLDVGAVALMCTHSPSDCHPHVPVTFPPFALSSAFKCDYYHIFISLFFFFPLIKPFIHLNFIELFGHLCYNCTYVIPFYLAITRIKLNFVVLKTGCVSQIPDMFPLYEIK